jgi:hypothetical protein
MAVDRLSAEPRARFDAVVVASGIPRTRFAAPTHHFPVRVIAHAA